MISFEKPSLVFYTQNRVNFFPKGGNGRDFLEDISEDDDSDTVLIIGYPQKFFDGGLQPNKCQYLDSGGAYILRRVSKKSLCQLQR
jgi:hypothetical protein